MNKKVAAPARKQRLTAVGIRYVDHMTHLYPQKLALTSPTGGGRSVGIVRSWTKATEFWRGGTAEEFCLPCFFISSEVSFSLHVCLSIYFLFWYDSQKHECHG